jgi:hypothetical protein
MKSKIFFIIITVLFLQAETLFQVKDSSDRVVLDVSSDGLRVLNEGDTVMVISSSEIKAVIDDSKALSRSFTVATSTSAKGQANVLEVRTGSTTMREGTAGNQYTDFSPENIFLGLNSGNSTAPDTATGKGIDNVFVGNQSGLSNHLGISNVFIGKEAGYSNIGDGTFLNGEKNVFIGLSAGYSNLSGACNVFVGKDAGKGNVSGIHNICIGTQAGYSIDQGAENVFIGGMSNFSGSGTGNVYLGYLSGMRATGDKNVSIGYRAGENLNGSNKLYIENSDSYYPLIYGEFDNDSVKINGSFYVSGNSYVEESLGIGTDPFYKIHSVDETTYSDNPSIFGKHNVSNNYGVGVRGEGGYRGVVGYASTTSFECRGLYGIATGIGTGTRYGVYGEASGGDTNWAGYFNGNVYADNISKAKDETVIDHPLDPENKILSHSTVNSSEMINVYNGNVILDSEGKASVSLPEWFESLNKDFRYQLTPVGAYAQIYISEEISGNKFEISGGKPGLKVSWQITGTRNDNFARANPIEVERSKKSNEAGSYLHPEAYGLPEESGIEYRIKKREE